MLAYSNPQRPCRKQQEKNETERHWFPSLPFQQFQVLFNSLFKVLCIFPSRYLYAIGLPPIFSFRWNLPPTLSCNPKQLDSSKAPAMVTHSKQERESHPLSCLFPKDLARNADRQCFYRPQLGTSETCTDSHGELFPLQSPLLGESWLVSFPPLNYMLKFSGYPY
jgi:hypothetical protein